ncbi:MAG: HpcH/HpaI aldolase family protein [Candidatus Bathyarchaeia archaeon]
MNKLRKLLDKGEPTIGTRTVMVWPGLVEVLGYTGKYDYVEFLAEYGPYSLHDLDNYARAAEIAGLSTIIKLDQEPKAYLAGRALASGIENFLFADIRCVEDAEEAVNAVRAEPKGKSGLRLDRRLGYVGAKATGADIVRMCDEAVIALMIEKKGAVENLEEILNVEGVDMVQFGPGDYSISIGKPGQTGDPEVKKAEIKTIETALDMGVTPRVEIRNPEEAKEYMDMGVKDFNLNIDLIILYSWWKNKGGTLRDILTNI